MKILKGQVTTNHQPQPLIDHWMDSLQEISALCSLYVFLSVSLCVTIAPFFILFLLHCFVPFFNVTFSPESKWTFGAVTCQETTGNLQSKRPVPSIWVDFLVPQKNRWNWMKAPHPTANVWFVVQVSHKKNGWWFHGWCFFMTSCNPQSFSSLGGWFHHQPETLCRNSGLGTLLDWPILRHS